MIITWLNYESILPEILFEKFIRYAHCSHGRAIIYINGNIRYATIDEY